MHSREVNTRLARAPVNHSGILDVLAKDKVRVEQVFAELAESTWLTPPGPLGGS